MQLTLPILLGIALADSINPVSFGVLIQLLKRQDKERDKAPTKLDQAGYQYAASFSLAYLSLGFALLFIFSILGSIQEHFFTILGAIIFLLGVLEANRILEFSSFLKRITSDPVERIKSYTAMYQTDPAISLALGINTAFRELIYTGGFYIGFLGLIALQSSSDGYMQLLLYNVIIVFPLVIITNIVKNHSPIKDFELWKPQTKRTMMLGISILQIILGIWLIFWWFV